MGWDRDSKIFGPNGELRDFVPLPGDPPLPAPLHGHFAARQRYGGVRVLSSATPPVPHSSRQATIIDTGDMGRVWPLDVQLRFATADANGNPSSPFSPIWPALGSQLNIKVRTAADPLSIPVVESFSVGLLQDTMPFDIFHARQLSVDLELLDTPGGSSIVVEAFASTVDQMAARDRRSGYPAIFNSAPAANPVSITLLASRNDRRQFIICNTSTNANLWIRFGSGATVGGPATLVLPKNQFATYESPIWGFRGLVSGIWDDPAPNGNALVTEGRSF